MKRYIKITSFGVFARDEIDKTDLLSVRDNRDVYIIDTQNQTYFSADENRWKPFEQV